MKSVEDDAPIIDLEEYVRDWAFDCYKDAKVKGDPSTDYLDVKIDWRLVHFDYEDPNYETLKCFRITSPKNVHSQVLLRTTFRNDTDGTQEYNFKAERTMRSSARISVEKGFKTGSDLRLTLKCPEEIIEVSGGISREIEVHDANEQTVEEELLWCIESKVVTPARTETCVKLVMNEALASSPFSVRVYYRGRVLARLYNRMRSNAYHSTIQGELYDVLQWAIEKKGLKGFNMRDEQKGAYTEVSGKCDFKFGIEQCAHVTQHPIDAVPDVGRVAIREDSEENSLGNENVLRYSAMKYRKQ